MTFTSPTTLPPGIHDLTGTVTDDLSGVDIVRVLVRNDTQYWNGSTWTPSWTWNDATVNGTNWTLPNVDLTQPDTYVVAIWAWDNAGNLANYTDNPNPTLTVT